MEELLLFLSTFVLVLVLYEIFIVKKAKSKKKKKEPVEISYLISRYSLDIKKLNYNKLLQIIAFTSSFDIALTVSVMMMFESFVGKLLCGIGMVVFTILVSYHIVYLLLKGGMKNDES